MTLEQTPLSGLIIIHPKVFGDERGFFMETWSQPVFSSLGIDTVFLQDNHSRSCRGTVRGLHFQSTPGQAKLVRCVKGAVWDVAVDLRTDSPTFGRWHAVRLDEDNRAMLYIPIGFAHGFCVLSESADFVYKVSSIYNPETECGIAWNDPDIGIQWPTDTPLLSDRDKHNCGLRDWLASKDQMV